MEVKALKVAKGANVCKRVVNRGAPEEGEKVFNTPVIVTLSAEEDTNTAKGVVAEGGRRAMSVSPDKGCATRRAEIREGLGR